MSRKQEENEKCVHVNSGLLRIKGFYFFCLGAIGDLLPFMALYMKQIGMTTSQTGIIYGLMPFVGFLVRPIFGVFADKTQRHRLVLIVLCILTGLCFNLMLLVPSTHLNHTKVNTEIVCSQADSFLRECYKQNESESSEQCPMSFHNYISKVKEVLEENRIVTFMNDSENVPYTISTLPSVRDHTLASDIQCSFQCNYKTVPTLKQVCFTNDTGIYSSDECIDVTLNGGSYQPHLALKVTDLAHVLSKEVIRDRIQIDDTICRDYDLKEIVYNRQEYWQMLCTEDSVFDCNLQCSHVDTCTQTVADDLTPSSFWFFFALFLLGNIFFSPIMSLGDAIAYDLLGEERRNKWGQQRLWGTIGFALFAVIATFTMDTLSSENTAINNFSIAFYMFSALKILTAFTAFTMKISDKISCGGMFKGTLKLLRDLRIAVFLFVLFFFGMLTGAIEAFLYWFLEADLGNKRKIIPGLCLLVSCSIETPVLFFAGHFIKRFGHVACFYIACLAYTIRFFGYSFLMNAWYVLPVELLHGFTFGLMWAAATSYGSIITPPGMSGTIQGLISGVHFGFGKGVGSLLTGQLYTLIGLRWTFRIYGISSLVILAVYFILNKFVFKDLPGAETEMKVTETDVEGSLLDKKNTGPVDEPTKVNEYHDEPVKDEMC